MDWNLHSCEAVIADAASKVVGSHFVQRHLGSTAFCGPVVYPLMSLVYTETAIHVCGVVYLENSMHVLLVMER